MWRSDTGQGKDNEKNEFRKICPNLLLAKKRKENTIEESNTFKYPGGCAGR